MPRLRINGIEVDLPHQPYPSQLVTISKLLSSFENGASALIESPTGTGKSLSIICSVLAFNAHVRNNTARAQEDREPYRIIICSRTHKQLGQLVNQLKKTSYTPSIAILGSRSQYCVNPRLNEIDDKNSGCSELIKDGKCFYYNGKEKLSKIIGEKLMDIEELRNEGKKCKGCPYFASRIAVRDADVIFAPYNYLMDSKVREAVDVPLTRTIVVIDEAHNVEDVCRMAGSLELPSQMVEIITNDLIGAIKRSALLGNIKGDFVNILDLFRRLREYAEKSAGSGFQEVGRLSFRETKENSLSKYQNKQVNHSKRAKIEECNSSKQEDAGFFQSKGHDSLMRIRKSKEVITELEEMGIKREFLAILKSSIKSIQGDEDGKEFLSLNSMRAVEDMAKVLEMIFEGCDAYAFCFQRFTSGDRYAFNLWLLDPGPVFRRLAREVWSISLLSGTLTPFASFGSELGFSFANQIVAPHILRPEQVFVANVGVGHLNKPLCGTFSTAETTDYLEQIAAIVSDVASKLREEGGTVVFVPSYSFLARLASRLPDAIPEPRNGGAPEFEKALKKYQMRIMTRRVAILICVFRGKAAEGTDFRDEYARAVISVGIPYPSVRDPQIALKKEYNDRKGGLNGRMWYEIQAFRAINQGLGRIIRHAKDWGVLYLLDSRFADKRYQVQLPQWVTKNLKVFSAYKDSLSGLESFIDSNRKRKRSETPSE